MESPALTATREILIPARDGKNLAADLYLPRGDGPWPTILVQTPYGKKRLGAALPHPAAHSWLDFWDRERYALLIADWRGYHASRDAGQVETPRHRGRDGFDLVEWIAEQTWSTGQVAGWGPSALGRALFRTAVEKPPHLVCGIPVVSHMGHFYEDFYEGGVLKLAHLRAVEALGFDLTPRVRNEPLSGTPFYRELLQEDRPELLNVPLLFVTGWFDLGLRQQLRFFEDTRRRGGTRARAYSRLIIGPWHHTGIDQRRQGELSFPLAAGTAARAARAFLAYWVEGDRANEWTEQPRVLYYQMGEDRWCPASHWPPTGLVEREWHLTPGGGLADEPPFADARWELVADPDDPVPTVGGANLPLTVKAGPLDQRAVAEREDVLGFASDPLTEPVRLVGGAFVTLTVSVDRPDADVVIRLTDVYPDGRSILLADSVRRLRHRESTSHVSPLTPGEPVTVTIRLPPVAQTFAESHRIGILVSGSNHPRYELNPHTLEDRFDSEGSVPARIRLHFGSATRATLTLPIRPEV